MNYSSNVNLSTDELRHLEGMLVCSNSAPPPPPPPKPKLTTEQSLNKLSEHLDWLWEVHARHAEQFYKAWKEEHKELVSTHHYYHHLIWKWALGVGMLSFGVGEFFGMMK